MRALLQHHHDARAQQLDIIADTALAMDPRLAPSTVLRQPCAARAEYSASSTVLHKPDSRVVAINKARITAGLSHEGLCSRSQVSVRNWYRLVRGEQEPSDLVLGRLRKGLGEFTTAKPPAVIQSYHRLVMILIATEQKFSVAALLATDFSVQRPQVPEWLQAARIHNMAVYVTTVELEVENAEFARALGISREAVRKARNKVEDLRDDPVIDELLSRVRQQVRAG